MPAIPSAAVNTKKRWRAASIAELHKYGNHMFDWSNVYRVGIFSRFLKVALGKGHKHSVPVGGTKIAYGLPSFKP